MVSRGRSRTCCFIVIISFLLRSLFRIRVIFVKSFSCPIATSLLKKFTLFETKRFYYDPVLFICCQITGSLCPVWPYCRCLTNHSFIFLITSVCLASFSKFPINGTNPICSQTIPKLFYSEWSTFLLINKKNYEFWNPFPISFFGHDCFSRSFSCYFIKYSRRKWTIVPTSFDLTFFYL